MLLICLYLKNKTKTKKKKKKKRENPAENRKKYLKKTNKQTNKQILLSEPGLELNCVCILLLLSFFLSFFFFNWKCKWLKLWTHPLAAVLVAHVGSLFWFRTKVCDFPGMWIPAMAMAEKNKNKNKTTTTTTKPTKQTNKKTPLNWFSFFFFSPPPPFFLFKYHFFKY